MKLARSTYYYRSRRAAAAKIIVRDRIVALCDEFPRYGYRRVTAQLKAEGTTINHKTVSRIMRDNGLQVRPLRRFVRTTDSDHNGPIFPNLVREFVPTMPNQLWVADFSYIAIAKGFVYLAAVLDAWSRRVVGYALARRLDTRLALAALNVAIETRRPPPGCIHHSDRGTQYASEGYREILAQHGFIGSMSRRGNPYDNAKAESFMKTLKTEEVDGRRFKNIEHAKRSIAVFIDTIYNAERLHSALGYCPPLEFEANFALALNPK